VLANSERAASGFSAVRSVGGRRRSSYEALR